MANLAQTYWNQIYSDTQNYQQPSLFLQQMLPRLQKGKTLEIGMGQGENAVFLAQNGFDVKGIDLSSVAVEKAQQLASKNQVNLEAKVADLDLHLFGMFEYDSIVMFNFKPSVPRYYSEFTRALKQAGTILFDSVTVEDMTEPLGPDDSYKNYFFKPNEILKSLSGLHILLHLCREAS